MRHAKPPPSRTASNPFGVSAVNTGTCGVCVTVNGALSTSTPLLAVLIHRNTYCPGANGPTPAVGNVSVPLVAIAVNVWPPFSHCQSTYPRAPTVPTGNRPIHARPPRPLLNVTVSGPLGPTVVAPSASVGPSVANVKSAEVARLPAASRDFTR